MFAEPAATAYPYTMKPFTAHSPSPRIAHRPRILTRLAMPCIALCMLLPGLARADQESKDPKKSKTPTEVTKPATARPVKAISGDKTKAEKVLLTGSLIPQQVARRTGALNIASPVYVIDSEQIRRSGATSVAGVLNRRGMNR